VQRARLDPLDFLAEDPETERGLPEFRTAAAAFVVVRGCLLREHGKLLDRGRRQRRVVVP
jgi:hypothetical protein